MMMLRLALLLLALLAPSAWAEKDRNAADKPQPQAPAGPAVTGLRVEIVERGLYQTNAPGQVRQMPNGIGENLVESVELMRSTTAIPARPGVSFGFEFVLHGQPAGTELELTTTVVFPPPGLRPPGAAGPVASSTTPMTVRLGEQGAVYRGYTFDYEWEVAPGPWRFEVRLGERILAVQSFVVTSESGFSK